MPTLTSEERRVAESPGFTKLLDSWEHLVYTNSSDEIFVHFKNEKTTIRISRNYILAWSHVNLIPTSCNGISAVQAKHD